MIEPGSMNSLFDADVVGSDDDRLGTVKQVYVDAETGEPQFITVTTGLFGTSQSFVPLDDATFDGETLHVGFDKATVKHAPRIENDGTLSEDEEERIWAYYGGEDAERREDARAERSEHEAVGPDYGAGVPVPLSGTVDEHRRDDLAEQDRYDQTRAAAVAESDRSAPADTRQGPEDYLRTEHADDAPPMTDPGARLRSHRDRDPATSRRRLRRHLATDGVAQAAPAERAETTAPGSGTTFGAPADADAITPLRGTRDDGEERS